MTSEYHIRLSGLRCGVDNMLLVSVWSFSSLNRAITLENQLVILGVSETDAGGYYVQAVNEKNGENKTSPFIHLSVAREYPNCGACAGTLGLQAGPTKASPIQRALLIKDWTFKGGQCFLLGFGAHWTPRAKEGPKRGDALHKSPSELFVWWFALCKAGTWWYPSLFIVKLWL